MNEDRLEIRLEPTLPLTNQLNLPTSVTTSAIIPPQKQTFGSSTFRARLHACFGGKIPGGSLPVELFNSACSATKSLYRLCTSHVRVEVLTTAKTHQIQQMVACPIGGSPLTLYVTYGFGSFFT